MDIGEKIFLLIGVDIMWNIPIRATSSECIIGRMERDGVYWIYQLEAARIVLAPVTLERIFALLHFGVHVEIFDGHAALDRAHDESLPIGKAAHASRLKLEWRLACVRHAHVGERPYADLAIGRRHDELVIACVQRVHFVGLLVRAHARGRGADVPQFDCVVPRACYDEAHGRTIVNTFDGVLMDAHCRFALTVPVERLELAIETTAERSARVDTEATVEYGLRMFVRRQKLIRLDIVQPSICSNALERVLEKLLSAVAQKIFLLKIKHRNWWST